MRPPFQNKTLTGINTPGSDSGSITWTQTNYSPAPTVNTIKVVVTDSLTGNPITHAKVSLLYNGKRIDYTTNTQGWVIFKVSVINPEIVLGRGRPGVTSATILAQATDYSSRAKPFTLARFRQVSPTGAIEATGLTSQTVSIQLAAAANEINNNVVANDSGTPNIIEPGASNTAAVVTTTAPPAAAATSNNTWLYLIVFLVVLFILYKVYQSKQA